MLAYVALPRTEDPLLEAKDLTARIRTEEGRCRR
jgi:hypothetical protein